MIHEKHIQKTMNKLVRLENNYHELIFEKVDEVSVHYMETDAHLYTVPADHDTWRPAFTGMKWGKAWGSAWFKGGYIIPEELGGKDIYIRARTDGVETLFWKDLKPRGIFTHPKEADNRGYHHTLLLVSKALPYMEYELAFESYAGHPCYGTQPFQTYDSNDGYYNRFERVFSSIDVLLCREDVKEFVFDLHTLNQLAASTVDGFRRAEVTAVLLKVFTLVSQSPHEVPETVWRPALARARHLMKPILSSKNLETAPKAGIVGHSHMDTAWLWTRDETIRKCARTYSNVLNLMEQYPEYTFIQSSAFHAELMRRHYPDIFEGMKTRIAEGRWEPNGGVWVECDCNLVSGESLVRQFLKGQQYTRQYFNYTSDTFWLPDTFGYSAAIPQIMAGTKMKYFLTTKLSWNDTNAFPYNTFTWRGIDGTDVLTHFNFIHCWPDAGALIERVYGAEYSSNGAIVASNKNYKAEDGRRLITYGYGDGGGGPQFEMLETAKRVRDLEGVPKAEHTLVSRFMNEQEKRYPDLPVHRGELYFELHRGSLTQMHQIKRNNRKAEFALRNLEMAEVWRRLDKSEFRESLGSMVSDRREALYELLLINQFHDILPGTSIPEVHDRAIQEVSQVIADAETLTLSLIAETGMPEEDVVTVWNPLSWNRNGTIAIENMMAGLVPTDPQVISQRFVDIVGKEKLLISGVTVPALGAITIRFDRGRETVVPSPFRMVGYYLETPFAVIKFNNLFYIESFMDKESGRELRRTGGHPLNAFLMGEDIPWGWDNWDIDKDVFSKLQLQTGLISSEIVSNGPIQLRIRNRYRIGNDSSLVQDMVFHADRPQIDFETMIDWKDKHQLLKVGFDVNILANTALHEIQFGHVERPTHTNTSIEQARFEVCAHKWTDLSESRFGVALLNDCKYGISVEGSDLCLSLHKGGTHPDPRGDVGVHHVTYAFLPHQGGFGTVNVIRPAYELNVPMVVIPGRICIDLPTLAEIDATNVIIETIKPSEDGQAFVLRLYEAERSTVIGAKLRLGKEPEKAILTNLLEEELVELKSADGILSLDFRPFEIKTVKIYY